MKRSYSPDPKPERRARKPIRKIDRDATTRAVFRWGGACVACGEPAANGHHIVPKGAPYFGDDVEENVAPLCGSGTSRCHGAFHGNPYEAEVSRYYALPDVVPITERRDRSWVAERIGRWVRETPPVLAYVVEKAGEEFLDRVYGEAS